MPATADDRTHPGPVLAGDDLPLPVGDIVYHEVDGTCLRVLGYDHEEDGETLVRVERVFGPTNWAECRNLSLLHKPPTKTETYQEMRARFQRDFDEFPLMFAYSYEQFDRALAERGWKKSELVRVMPGCFIRKQDAKRLREMTDDHDRELRERMTDHDFAVDAFMHEMGDHEYHLDAWQGDWDVCSMFGTAEYVVDKDGPAYLAEMGYDEVTQEAYRDARRRYYQLCDERGWW